MDFIKKMYSVCITFGRLLACSVSTKHALKSYQLQLETWQKAPCLTLSFLRLRNCWYSSRSHRKMNNLNNVTSSRHLKYKLYAGWLLGLNKIQFSGTRQKRFCAIYHESLSNTSLDFDGMKTIFFYYRSFISLA